MTDDPGPAHRRAAPREADLLAEFRRLCRGRGVQAPDLLQRLGPRLSAHLSARLTGPPGARTPPADPRRALLALLADLADALPDDLRTAARAALGLDPRLRFLQERQHWLARHLERDVRTARRRVDDALALMAEALESSASRAPAGRGGAENSMAAAPGKAAPSKAADWYAESVQALLRLDQDAPTVHEERRIVVTAPTLEVITVSVSLPRAPAAGSGARRTLLADMLFGGLMAGTERPSESHFRFLVRPPGPLRAGDRHSFGLCYRVPAGQPMAPHYALTPLNPCAEFRLRIRFAADRPPARVWLLDGVPPRALDDDPAGLPLVPLDAAGEAEARFTDLALGLGYGFRWSG
ncbi:hypothetical protein [Actinomadura roseirufa]|uniref:hypothetical protein n=1 Tax=Actinomadura roseirufa TaxID=2094049 RepID=UPI001040FA34|nr:hypothetical protein [Actinomadura roseirufa]